MVETKTTMLPVNSLNACNKIAVKDWFPTTNITDIIDIAIARFEKDVEKADKSVTDSEKFANEITKDAKCLIKEKRMSDKLYGWKKDFKEKLK